MVLGKEEFTSVIGFILFYFLFQDNCIRSVDGYVVVFSITSRNNFENTPIYFQKIFRAKDSEKEPIVIF